MSTLNFEGRCHQAQVDGRSLLDPPSAFYELYSGMLALQSAARTDQLDAYSDCKARLRSSVQRIIETRTDTPASRALLSAALNAVEDALGRENCFYSALSRNLNHLPLSAIGEEEADLILYD